MSVMNRHPHTGSAPVRSNPVLPDRCAQRTRFRRLTRATIGLVAAGSMCFATGCQSTGNQTAGTARESFFKWPWTPDASGYGPRDSVAQTSFDEPVPGKLKNPEKLYLAHAQLKEQTQDYAKARESYEAVLAENAQSAEAVVGLARLDLLAGRNQEAERRFLKALDMAPSDLMVIEAVGQFYITQQRYDEAVRTLERGVELAPGNKRLRHRLALALARQGNIAAAEPHFIEAVGAAEADYNLGLILHEKGDLASAEQRFLQATIKKPQLSQAQHWLDRVRQEQDAQLRLASGMARNAYASTQNIQTQIQAAQNGTMTHPHGTTTAPAAGGFQYRQPGAEQGVLPDYPPSAGLPQRTLPYPAMGAVSGAEAVQSLTSEIQTPGVTPPAQTGSVTIQPASAMNPSQMSATQLEQLQNSMTPQQREQFRAQLQSGRF